MYTHTLLVIQIPKGTHRQSWVTKSLNILDLKTSNNSSASCSLVSVGWSAPWVPATLCKKKKKLYLGKLVLKPETFTTVFSPCYVLPFSFKVHLILGLIQILSPQPFVSPTELLCSSWPVQLSSRLTQILNQPTILPPGPRLMMKKGFSVKKRPPPV